MKNLLSISLTILFCFLTGVVANINLPTLTRPNPPRRNTKQLSSSVPKPVKDPAPTAASSINVIVIGSDDFSDDRFAAILRSLSGEQNGRS